MAEFVYNNCKNIGMDYIIFKLNYGYYPWVPFENKYDTCSRSFSANELAINLSELINICCQNFLHIQDLWKRAYNKRVFIVH